ncbi:MAG: YeeE/YedE family protein, partial [Bdellovibrionales bacterium]|nr:YeeE/YedE family protein [Bdellovibrionales bacterium]
MKGLVSFIVGVLFAIGLGYSGMTKPDVVKGFLDIFGNWDPSLIGVMIGAILVHGVSYQIIKKRSSPLLD